MRMTDPESNPSPSLLAPHREHPRLFHENRFVYPVLSRRSQGISLGINLNPDKVCNFDCVYCQVDRRSDSETTFVDTGRLFEELESTLDVVVSGALYDDERFRDVPERLRRLNDIAFSGDGEPTSFRNIDAIVERVAALKRAKGLDGVKLVMITNASLFHRPAVRRALAALDASGGEVWAKLDAGTEAYFRRVERTSIPFQRILDNLLDAARVRPLVIQSLFLTLHGEGPDDAEVAAYCDRLATIVAQGGAIDRVQVYTVARRPAESEVGALPAARVDAIAAAVTERVGVRAEAYYGSGG